MGLEHQNETLDLMVNKTHNQIQIKNKNRL